MEFWSWIGLDWIGSERIGLDWVLTSFHWMWFDFDFDVGFGLTRSFCF